MWPCRWLEVVKERQSRGPNRQQLRPPLAALVLASWMVLGGRASAAELRLRTPGDCVARSDILDQVETILGRPLATVPEVDFEVDITAARGASSWRLRMETVPRAAGQRRLRELAGRSCAELGDAAAVAIAMAVQSTDEPAEPAGAPVKPVASPPGSPIVTTAAPASSRPRPRLALALALLLESGALARGGPGVTIEGSLDLGSIRLVAGGTRLAAQEVRISPTASGTFGLFAGSLLACLVHTLGRFTALGCAGGEIGQLSGEGAGNVDSRRGTALWLAGRAELGGGYPVTHSLWLVMRGGVAVPTRRPVFVIDGTTEVHQPSALTGRGTLGFEIVF